MALTLEQTLADQARKREQNLGPAEAKQEAKKQIITRYLNTVPFGNNAFGVEAASLTYSVSRPASSESSRRPCSPAWCSRARL